MKTPSHEVQQKSAIPVKGLSRRKTLVVYFVLVALSVGSFLVTENSSSDFISVLPVTGEHNTIQNTLGLTPLQSSQQNSPNHLIALRVEVQEVLNNVVVQSGFEPPLNETIGQFEAAYQRNNIGLIAHSYLAGGDFFRLWPGMLVQATLADGSYQVFEIYKLTSYQASDPYDFSKPFVDLVTGDLLDPVEVFDRAYQLDELTFQTCIEIDGVPTWGVFFAQAKALNR